MRKLLASSLMVIGTVSAVALATRAFFSDTETATGNTFTAGAIDLQIDSTAHYNGMICADNVWYPEDVDPEDRANFDHADWNEDRPTQYPQSGTACTGSFAFTDLDGEKFFSYADVKPGDEGENTISMHIFNNDAWACMSVGAVTDADNTLTEPEEDVNDNLTSGELSTEMMVFAWMDPDGDNVYESGEKALTAAPMLFKDFAGKSYALADSSVESGTGGAPLPGVSNASAASGYVGVQWCAGTLTLSGTTLSCDGESMGNEAQTDSLLADIGFTVEQARNNEDFVCDVGPVGEVVGAAFAGYDDPATCAYTVSGTESLQAAINGASAGQIICVDSTYTGSGDAGSYFEVNKPNLTIAGVGTAGAATVGKGMHLDANGVTITGLTLNNFSFIESTEKAALYINSNLNGITITHNKIIAPAGAKAANAKGIITEIGNSGTPGASGLSIQHNLVQGWNQGMFFNTANYNVGYNDIIDNNVGVANDGPHASSIHHNDFEENDSEAVGVAPKAVNGTSNDGILAVNTNNFTPAGAGNNVNWYGPSLLGGADVNAANNWWSGEVEAVRTNDDTEVETEPAALVAYPEN